MTVALNDHLLGTLTAPEKLSAGRMFRLNDGSSITVRVVNEQLEVRYNGWRLAEAGSTPAVQRKALSRRDKVTKGIVLLCALFATVVGLLVAAALGYLLLRVLLVMVSWFFSWFLSGLSQRWPEIALAWHIGGVLLSSLGAQAECLRWSACL
jgi:hypothetical protein